MTEFVLLGLRNAEILIGYRILFVDRPTEELLDNNIHIVRLDDHDGWILEHPELGPAKWFMNRKWVEKEFTVLGEL